MTKVCTNCGCVGDFQTEALTHVVIGYRSSVFYGRETQVRCGPLKPCVLIAHQPLSSGALAPGAVP